MASPAEMTVWVRTDGRLVCPRCAAPYHPALVGGECPLCREPTPGLDAPAARTPIGEGDRTLLLVGLATIANLVLLGVLAVLVLHV